MVFCLALNVSSGVCGRQLSLYPATDPSKLLLFALVLYWPGLYIHSCTIWFRVMLTLAENISYGTLLRSHNLLIPNKKGMQIKNTDTTEKHNIKANCYEKRSPVYVEPEETLDMKKDLSLMLHCQSCTILQGTHR